MRALIKAGIIILGFYFTFTGLIYLFRILPNILMDYSISLYEFEIFVYPLACSIVAVFCFTKNNWVASLLKNCDKSNLSFNLTSKGFVGSALIVYSIIIFCNVIINFTMYVFMLFTGEREIISLQNMNSIVVMAVQVTIAKILLTRSENIAAWATKSKNDDSTNVAKPTKKGRFKPYYDE